MNARQQELHDAGVLVDIATKAGVPTEAAKKIAQALGDLPLRQALRICGYSGALTDEESKVA